MSDMPSYSFFNDLNEDFIFNTNESVCSSKLDQSFNESFPSSCVDLLPVCDFTSSLDGYSDPYNNLMLFNDVSNLSDNVNFSLNNQSVNSYENESSSPILYDCNPLFDKIEETLLPSGFITDTESFNSLDNHSESPQNLESFLTELDLPDILLSDQSEDLSLEEKDLSENLLSSSAEEIFLKESNSSSSFQDKQEKTNQVPLTLVLRKFKGDETYKMVVPFDIPKPTRAYVEVPGVKKIKKVRVINLKDNSQNKFPKPEIQISHNIKHETTNLKCVDDDDTIMDVDEQQLDLEDLPFTSLKRRLSNKSKPSKSIKKQKAYELAPCTNPQWEKCRRNAINAKKNREMKKERMVKLEEEVEKVMQEKQILSGENKTLKQKNLELEKKIEYLTNLLKDDRYRDLMMQNQSNNRMNMQEPRMKLNVKL